jgi:hypothetical protein
VELGQSWLKIAKEEECQWSLHLGCDWQENEFDEKHRVATTLLREKAELEKSREDEV